MAYTFFYLIVHDLWFDLFLSNEQWFTCFQDDKTFLSFKKAELIYLIKDDEFSVARGWLKGKNERTGEIGAVPTDAVLILPTLTKPKNEVLVRTWMFFSCFFIFYGVQRSLDL